MLILDHLTVIAPSLAEGVDHVRSCLDFDVPVGGTHPEMGTHNHVMRLGDHAYLEVIAVDPDAPPPAGPRWFGFQDPDQVRRDWEAGRRLRGWVAHSDDLDRLLAAHGELFGGKTRISRAGFHSDFSLLPGGELPLDGALPSVIDRGGRPQPFTRMEDLGFTLLEFKLEHPQADSIATLYDRLGIRRAPELHAEPELRYSARIDTPDGVRKLT